MRFPDDTVTIIALCNAADAAMEPLADAVAELVLPPARAAPPTGDHLDTDTRRVRPPGLYYSGATNQRVPIGADTGGLILVGPSLRLVPLAARRSASPRRLPSSSQPAVGRAG